MDWEWGDLWKFITKHGDSLFAWLGSVATVTVILVKRSADKRKHKQDLILREFDQTIKDKDKLASDLATERAANARLIDQQIKDLEHDLEICRARCEACASRLGERDKDLEEARKRERELEAELRTARTAKARNERR